MIENKVQMKQWITNQIWLDAVVPKTITFDEHECTLKCVRVKTYWCISYELRFSAHFRSLVYWFQNSKDNTFVESFGIGMNENSWLLIA